MVAPQLSARAFVLHCGRVTINTCSYTVQVKDYLRLESHCQLVEIMITSTDRGIRQHHVLRCPEACLQKLALQTCSQSTVINRGTSSENREIERDATKPTAALMMELSAGMSLDTAWFTLRPTQLQGDDRHNWGAH